MRNLNTDAGKVRKTIIEVGYRTAAQFFTKRGELIAASESNSVQIALEENSIEVRDNINKCVKRIGFFRSSITSEHVEPLGPFSVDMAADWLRGVIRVLSIGELRRVGMRQMMVYPGRGPFDDLLAECRTHFIPIPDSSWEKLGGEPSDIGLPLEFDFGDCTAHLMMGPMKTEQMKQLFDNTEGLPGVGMFVDWDYRTSTPTTVDNLPVFLQDVSEHKETKIRPFLESLEG